MLKSDGAQFFGKFMFAYIWAPCLAKFLLWSYCQKCYWPVRLQDSLKCNISKKLWEKVSHSQTCTKYPKQQFCNIFAISQKRMEG